MGVELSYGSHDLEPLGQASRRRIYVVAYEPAATRRTR